MSFVKEPHTAIFSGPTKCGKTKCMLDLLEAEYQGHFENIVILCPTLKERNPTYLDKQWIWKDDYIFLIDPGGRLFEWIKTLSERFKGKTTLFILDDIINDEKLDKKRQSLLGLAIAGRYREHSLWMLTQSYSAIPKNLRRQKKQLFVWYLNERSDLSLVDEETNVIDDWTKVKNHLRSKKHACIYVRLEFPRGFLLL